MKRVLIIAGCLLFTTLQAVAQTQFYEVVKEYFRVDPFAGKFSSFVEAVRTDPELENPIITDKTDTSLFSVTGNYKSFNPFALKANNVEIMLAEKKVRLNTTPERYDTLLFYQITGFFDSTEQTLKTLKKEYKRINKKIRQTLPVNSEAPLNKIAGLQDGAIINHAVHASLAAPVSLAWYIKKDGELALMLVLRMKYANNLAYPAGTLHDYYNLLN